MSNDCIPNKIYRVPAVFVDRAQIALERCQIMLNDSISNKMHGVPTNLFYGMVSILICNNFLIIIIKLAQLIMIQSRINISRMRNFGNFLIISKLQIAFCKNKKCRYESVKQVPRNVLCLH